MTDYVITGDDMYAALANAAILCAYELPELYEKAMRIKASDPSWRPHWQLPGYSARLRGPAIRPPLPELAYSPRERARRSSHH